MGERSCPFLERELCSVLRNPCPFIDLARERFEECPYYRLAREDSWDYSPDPLAF